MLLKFCQEVSIPLRFGLRPKTTCPVLLLPLPTVHDEEDILKVRQEREAGVDARQRRPKLRRKIIFRGKIHGHGRGCAGRRLVRVWISHLVVNWVREAYFFQCNCQLFWFWTTIFVIVRNTPADLDEYSPSLSFSLRPSSSSPRLLLQVALQWFSWPRPTRCATP